MKKIYIIFLLLVVIGCSKLYVPREYIGELKNGERHGQGTLTWRGRKYEGEWKDGEKNGKGTQTTLIPYSCSTDYKKTYERYVGEWEDDKYNGQGTLTWGCGYMYKGEWKNGRQYGQGTLTYPDGRNLVGEFKYDRPWNITEFDKDGSALGRMVNGKKADLVYTSDQG